MGNKLDYLLFLFDTGLTTTVLNTLTTGFSKKNTITSIFYKRMGIMTIYIYSRSYISFLRLSITI